MVELLTTQHHLSELQRRLAQGWHVEEPLLRRSVLHGWDGRRSLYEVIICKDGERHVIALTDEPEIEDFLEQRQFVILEV